MEGATLKEAGEALGRDSSLQEMRTAVGSRRPRPGHNDLTGRYGQDKEGSGISPLRPGCKQARRRGSPPSRLPASLLFAPLPTLAVASRMAGIGRGCGRIHILFVAYGVVGMRRKGDGAEYAPNMRTYTSIPHRCARVATFAAMRLVGGMSDCRKGAGWGA